MANGENKINKKLIQDFANIIGNINILLYFDSFEDVKKEYRMILNELLEWVRNYYLHKNFDTITYEKSFEIHNILEEIKWKKIIDTEIGNESLLTDNILIRYEIIMKTINDERSNVNAER